MLNVHPLLWVPSGCLQLVPWTGSAKLSHCPMGSLAPDPISDLRGPGLGWPGGWEIRWDTSLAQQKG